MRKVFCLMFYLLTVYSSVNAQLSHSMQEINAIQKKASTSPADTNKISLLIQLGNLYVENNPYLDSKLTDSSYSCFKQALDLSIKLNSTAWKNKSIDRLAYVENDRGYNDRAIQIEQQLVKYYAQHNDFKNEAQSWENIGEYSPGADFVYGCFKKARLLFRKAGDKLGEIGALKVMGDNRLQANKLDSATLILNDVVKRYLDINYKKKLHYVYDLLAVVASYQGHDNDELFYRLATVKNMEAVGDFRFASTFYDRLARAYWNVENYQQCLYYARKSFERGNTPFTYNAMEYVIKALQALNRNNEALEFLQMAIKKYPAVRDGEENIALVAFGNIYFALKQNDKAEENYLQALKLYLIWEHGFIKDTTDHAVHYMRPIRFYIKTKQFKKATFYLGKIPPGFDKNIVGSTLTELFLFRFKVDSAFHNYAGAINNYQVYKKLSDADRIAKNVKNAEEFQNKYDRDKREHDITLLQSEQKVQKITIQRAVSQRNITLAAIVLALILIGFGYNVFRRKQLSALLIAQKNNQLQLLLANNEQSNAMINKKNDQLQLLLIEKDWLLKEVHHRVKNNLHTVFCLLESQAKYLADDALKAVEVSQHRIYAMSLIHQKLYQSDDIKTVDMGVYLAEFIGYLIDSFDTGEYIRFELNITSVTLDIAQAIPVALIINEAVTNAIKYAFPDGRNGIITISFQNDEDEILLNVADNGIGINSVIDLEQLNSLGLVLMQGLTEDLHGTFTIKSEHGTKVEVVFPTAAALVV